ncbi:MAG: nicotinate-nucleotide adenylyltransferase [Candidatus Omnitrophota bacterium]|jgi:nicotinate-nucleotide adenylyltransferase|nr:MAG: nicotinate-nucleotide adenylyltransferase [Candidatus Omnitrophota bacterium]
MKLGILGGTFNPIHVGHLIMAEEIREKLSFDHVIFVPTFLPPHKDSSDIASAGDRYKMVKMAIEGNKYFSVSDIEIKRKGPSFTIDTLGELRKVYPKAELFFITGSDLLNYLDEWKDLDEIIKMVKFIVATRPGYPLEKIPSYISKINIRAVDISAFEIRKSIREGKSFRYLVPDKVFRYILRKRLYI